MIGQFRLNHKFLISAWALRRSNSAEFVPELTHMLACATSDIDLDDVIGRPKLANFRYETALYRSTISIQRQTFYSELQ
jgi:hypothetical protein